MWSLSEPETPHVMFWSFGKKASIARKIIVTPMAQTPVKLARFLGQQTMALCVPGWSCLGGELGNQITFCVPAFRVPSLRVMFCVVLRDAK
jgi:hypothetical protein